jgi:hypothetical protein
MGALQAVGLKAGVSEFLPVRGANPDLGLKDLPPSAPVPSNAGPAVYDTCDNHWALAPQDSSGNRGILVLPAQDPAAWRADTVSNPPAGPWKWLAADESGYLWAASERRLARLDPRHAEKGWLDLTHGLGPNATVTALGIAPSGSVMVSLGEGWLIEIDGSAGEPSVRRTKAPPGASLIGCDEAGRCWLRSGGGWWMREAAPDAWQRDWKMLARLPGGNHDLAGDSLGQGFVFAGGQTADWGFPVRHQVFSEVFALESNRSAWRTVARLGGPRFYNGTTVLNGEVWIVAGNYRDASGMAHFLDTVEIADPATGRVREGPRLPFAFEMPVSARLGGRIYVAGGADPAVLTATPGHRFDGPGRLFSIGAGEREWRREPDAPVSFNNIAGTSCERHLYLAVPKAGLVRFDAATAKWEVIGGPAAPRSPQMACFRDEVWLMGGRDVADGRQTLIFTPRNGAWRAGPRLPRDLSWGAGGVLNGRLMITGGAGDPGGYSNRTFILR